MHSHNEPSNLHKTNDSTTIEKIQLPAPWLYQFRECAYTSFILDDSKLTWNLGLCASFAVAIGVKYCHIARAYGWHSEQFNLHKAAAKKEMPCLHKKHDAIMIVPSLFAGGVAFFLSKRNLDKIRRADKAQSGNELTKSSGLQH